MHGRRLLAALVSVSTSVAVASSCGPAQGIAVAPDGGSYDCSGTTPADLSDLYATYFAEAQATGCSASGCHGTGAGGLQFRSAPEMWAATVGHPSGVNPEEELIHPGDPAHSVIFQRLAPGASGRMPQGGPYLDETALARVAGWICAGAPRPSTQPVPDGGQDGGPVDAGEVDAGTDAGVPTPTITGFDPSSGVEGTAVTITGDGFSSDAAKVQVTFNGVAAVVASVTSTTVASAVPSGATTGPISVAVNGVTATSLTDFQVIQPNPMPSLSAISPSTTLVGASGVTLTVSGASFVALSTVELDGTALVTQAQNSTTLTAQLTASDLAIAASHTVTVTTPGPGGGTSGALSFVVENPQPVITSVTPNPIPVGSAGTTITISGSGFVAETQALLNGAPASSTYVSPTELHVVVSQAQLSSAGTLSLAISTPGPGGGVSEPFTLTITNPTPTASQVSPTFVLAGSGTATLSVSGSGFVPLSEVTLDGAPLSTTPVSASQLAATFGSNLTAVAGMHTVGVTNPGPGGGRSGTLTFTVNNPAPEVANTTPAFCVAGISALSLTVSGGHFVPGVSVSFGGAVVPATLVDSSTISVSVPGELLAMTGAKSISITNPGPGGGTASANFEIRNPAPVLTSISPGTAAPGSNVTLTARGTGFVAASAIVVDGFTQATTFIDSATLTTTIAGGSLSTGTHLVAVTTPGPGGGTTADVALLVLNPAPTVASASPATLLAGSGDTSITVTGAGFLATSAVTINGTPASSMTVSETELAAIVPAALLASAGRLSVVVVNGTPGGGSSTAVPLAVVNPTPAITSLSPASVATGSGSTSLTVSGTGIVTGTVVELDGAALATDIAAGQARATIDAAVAATGGTHAITLTNPAPGGGTSAPATWTVNNPTPTVTSLNPSSVGANGAPFSLTVTGSGFVSGSTVNLAGAAVATTYSSGMTLTAAIPTLSTGSYSITVTSPTPGGGTSAGVTLVATAAPIATITGLNPALVVSNAPFTLTVTGSGFSCSGQLSVVSLGGTSYSPATCSSTQLTASVPALTAGAYSVLVQTQARSSNTATLTVSDPNPVPALASLSPTVLGAGSPATTLTVDGANFVAGSIVLFNGSNRATNYVSASRLTAALLAADLSSPGTFPITVQSPAPGGGTSDTVSLEVVAPNPVPTLSSATPDSATVGSGALNITLTGGNFVGGAIASLNGNARTTTFVSSSSLTLALIAADTQSAGTSSITVTNPGPGGGSSGAITFNVIALNPVPTIASLNPGSAVAGGSGFTLTINGSSFVPGALVSWAGANRAAMFLSESQLSIEVTADDLAAEGSVDIAVINPGPGGGTSNTLALPIAHPNPVPILSTLSPSSVEAGSGATSITLTGSNFLASSAATFNGSTRTTHFVSSTQLAMDLVAADTQSPGSFPIVVSNPSPGGGSSSAATLSIFAPNPMPLLTALTPSSVATGSGAFSLSVTGTGFVAGSSVSLNGSPAVTTYGSATQLTATVPASLTSIDGTVTVAVTNPAPGGGTSNALSFVVETMNPAPTITSLSPASGVAGSGAITISVTGTGFVPGSVASFSGFTRTTHYSSATQVTVELLDADLLTAGSYPVVVTNPAPGGGTSNSYAFGIVAPNPAPQLSSLSPVSVGVGSSGQLLTVNGSGFVSGSVIVFNGVNRTTSFVSATQLATSLSGADLATAGTFAVAVTSPAPGGGTTASLSFSVTNPSPTISSLSPTTFTVGVGAVSLSVNGTGMVSSSVVQVDGSARTTHRVNSTLVTADLLSADTSSIGTHTITVVNPAPGGGTSAGTTLTIADRPNPVPAISSLSPCGAVAGAAGFTLTIGGSNFVSGVTATFNGTAVPVTFVSASQINATIASTLIASAPSGNSVNVIVSNPTPGGGASNAYGFGVAAHAATLSGNVQPIFTASCASSGCHTGANPAQGLNLSSGQSYANLVGIPCTECSSRQLVMTCGPGTLQSYLVAKLKGTNLCSGSQMPKGAPLSSTQQTIIDWIAQGTP